MATAFFICVALTNINEYHYTLDNGLSVILIPEPNASLVMVALGVRAGVFDEPPGQCGVAHMSEHLFWYGASKSYPQHRAFEQLAKEGPLGKRYIDVNAETMWNLTYYYAVRSSNKITLPIAILADKLNGITVTRKLLDAERTRVLMEIEAATQTFNQFPQLKTMLQKHYHNPKAGIAAEVKALTVKDVQSFLAQHYRPDRCTVVIRGKFNPIQAGRTIHVTLGQCRNIDVKTVAMKKYADTFRFAIDSATPQELLALRVLASALQRQLQVTGQGHVEVAPSGQLTVHTDNDAMKVPQLRKMALRTLTQNELANARSDASAIARARDPNSFNNRLWATSVKNDPVKQKMGMLQSTIDRLLFETEGGQRFLTDVKQLTSEDVVNVAEKYLK